jgi:hypothetical protein
MKFVATKKRYDNKFLSPLSFVAAFRSWIRDGLKIMIRDKHPGSATLVPAHVLFNKF